MLTVKQLANSLNAECNHINKIITDNHLPVEFIMADTIRGPRSTRVLPPETERFLRERFRTMARHDPKFKFRHHHGEYPLEARQFLVDLVKVSEKANGPVDVGKFINEYKKILHDGVR